MEGMGSLDEYLRSPLHYVCIDHPREQWLSIARKLIASGEDINRQDKHGWSPLHFAAQEGAPEIASLLIEAGANIEPVDENGNTPLWVAAMHSHHGSEVANILLANGADPDKENKHGISPREISPELFENAT